MSSRIASVWIPEVPEEADRELTAALLTVSPRVGRAAPDLWRAGAGGWSRRGGEEALAEALREATAAAGAPGSRVGVADVPVASDAAARAAGEDSPVRVVPEGGSRPFLASLPPDLLPVSDEMLRTLRSLGIRRIEQVAARSRWEWAARFGPEGLRLHRWARGRDDRGFRPVRSEDLPGASVEVEEGVEELEPLLFLLRRLLDRTSRDLRSRGKCAARLRLRLLLEEGEEETAEISPARPTRRPELLMDLCRAALERRFREGDGKGGAPAAEEGPAPRRVRGVALEVERTAGARARQGHLFARRWRDPMQAAATLSRLRARLGREGVVAPDPDRDHRPEARSRWTPVEGESPGDVPSGLRRGSWRPEAPPPVLRLLPEPRRVEVRTGGEGRSGGGPPAEVWDDGGRHGVLAAEGPERLSGDWWEDPYRREYYRVCTDEGELLWIFREYRRDGRFRWWLHGWWD